MANVVYVLCAVTSVICAYLLLRGFRKSGERLLLWGGGCFVFLAISNLLLVVDYVVVPAVDLSLVRVVPVLVGVCLLLFGLIWESR